MRDNTWWLKILVILLVVISISWISWNIDFPIIKQNIEVEETVLPYTLKDIDCLEQNIHHESDGEPFVGKLAVGLVTVNRAKKSGKSLCEVVWEPNQFEWTSKPIDYNRKISPDTKLATFMVINNVLELENISQVTYFHNHTVKPEWATKKKHVVTIGRHKFYEEK